MKDLCHEDRMLDHEIILESQRPKDWEFRKELIVKETAEEGPFIMVRRLERSTLNSKFHPNIIYSKRIRDMVKVEMKKPVDEEPDRNLILCMDKQPPFCQDWPRKVMMMKDRRQIIKAVEGDFYGSYTKVYESYEFDHDWLPPYLFETYRDFENKLREATKKYCYIESTPTDKEYKLAFSPHHSCTMEEWGELLVTLKKVNTKKFTLSEIHVDHHHHNLTRPYISAIISIRKKW
jgi:hypothetical protein